MNNCRIIRRLRLDCLEAERGIPTIPACIVYTVIRSEQCFGENVSAEKMCEAA